MTEKETRETGESKITGESGLSNKLTALGFGMFFIWFGITILSDLGTGIGFLGVGIIILSIQVVRKFYNLELEVFWLVIGILFMVSGLWELFEADLPLVPILLIVAGVALLVSTLRGKRSGVISCFDDTNSKEKRSGGMSCCGDTKGDSTGSGDTDA
jgi:hypothetical protein